MRPQGPDLADIFHQVGPAYRQDHADSLSHGQRRVMTDIERCRTARRRPCSIIFSCTVSGPAVARRPMGSAGSPASRASSCRSVRVLSALFRRLFLSQLRQAFADKDLHLYNTLAALEEPQAFANCLAPVANADWVVYAKRPFGGPEQVLEYLGRYTHRVAISNNRLLDLAGGPVDFRWKDYCQEVQPKIMRLEATEFVRRFLWHDLPSGFQRIRHCGLLANCYREVELAQCRQLLLAPPPVPVDEALDCLDRCQRLTGKSLRECPHCGRGQMLRIDWFLPGAQPRRPPSRPRALIRWPMGHS